MDCAFLIGQYEAALSTLNYCIKNCPDAEWHEAHNDAPFSQVVFHALFYSDFYLDESEASFKAQQFHTANKTVFADYEELENRIPVGRYDKDFCREYLLHSLAKVRAYFSDKDESELLSPSAQHGKIMTRLELFVYTLRHIQHHAAQLGLRIQYLSKKEMPWFRTGWTE